MDARSWYLNEAVMEVNSEQAGGEAGVVPDGLLEVGPHQVLHEGAGGVVEVEGEAIR